MDQMITDRLCALTKQKMSVSAETMANIKILAFQISAHSKEDTQSIVDVVLYITGFARQLYSHHKVREMVDSLKTIPVFMTLDSYRLTCEDKLDALLDKVKAAKNAQRLGAMFQSLKDKYKDQSSKKQMVINEIRGEIEASTAKYADVAQTQAVESYPDWLKIAENVFYQQIKKNQLIGWIFQSNE